MKYKFGLWKYDDGIKISYTPFFDKLGDENLDPLIDYFVLLGHHYVSSKQANNIDNWLGNIEKQIYLKDNEEYYGDNVCVFFESDKVRIVNYRDYELGLDKYLEIQVNELRKLTIEWKWFVIEWEINKIIENLEKI